ncbi:MAG: ankyrin repeat domain-containing protein [Chrysiogenetes bacterium]|nr:ankyrin repeat domain-containing protein [Chrysiogenetes bacterium]
MKTILLALSLLAFAGCTQKQENRVCTPEEMRMGRAYVVGEAWEASDPVLFGAVAAGDLALARRQIAEGADPSGRSKYASHLEFAIWREDLEMVRLLIASGAAIGQKEFASAVSSHDTELARVVLDALKEESAAPIPDISMQIAVAAYGDDVPMIALLREYGLLNLSACENNALYAASLNEAHKAMEYLLDSGAPANGPAECDSESPLMAAAYNGDRKGVDLLLRHGADPAQVHDGWTAAESAAAAGHYELADYLRALAEKK